MSAHFDSTIRNGQLVLAKRNLFTNYVKAAPEGHYLLLLIRLDNDRNERDWQKYYRALLKEMSGDTGHDPRELHEMAKADVLLKEMGLTSTTDLDSISWRVYIELLGQWSLESFDFVI